MLMFIHNVNINMYASVDPDHYPHLAENGGAYILAEQIGLSQVELSDANERRSALAAMPAEELAQSFIKLNAASRQLDPQQATVEDGKMHGSDTPPLDDKMPLLIETGQAVKNILSNPELDNAAALRRAGLTFAGAAIYTHPSSDGVGRTARLMHYFIEYGAERGEELFEAETRSILGKMAVYEIDKRMAVYVTPHDRMERALTEHCRNQDPQWDDRDSRAQATARVRAFLDAATGNGNVQMADEAHIRHNAIGEFAIKGVIPLFDKVPAGADLFEIYEAEYTANSFAARIKPEDIPSNTTVVAYRSSTQKIPFAFDEI